MSFLSNVRIIGDNFLQNCSKLIDIDLTPLTNLHIIGLYFLNNCYNLKSIKITLSQIRSFDFSKKTLNLSEDPIDDSMPSRENPIDDSMPSRNWRNYDSI